MRTAYLSSEKSLESEVFIRSRQRFLSFQGVVENDIDDCSGLSLLEK
jgi:hypothetical protein